MIRGIVASAAAADCERIRTGLIAEPVNTMSSLGYLVAGAWLLRCSRLYGAVLFAVGVGSVAYHGPGGPGARWLHDATLVLLAAVIAVAAPRIARGMRARPVLTVFGAGALALAVPLQLFGRDGGSLCRPDSAFQAHAGWHLLTAAALLCVFVLAATGARLDRRTIPASEGRRS